MKNFIPILTLSASLAALTACSSATQTNAQASDGLSSSAPSAAQAPFIPNTGPNTAEAIVAGGCFWCVESDFEKLPGVKEVISGYSGGTTVNPTYKQVGRGKTGHIEVAKIIYDPTQISYRKLIDHYWTTVDPTDDGGQFCDRGQVYETALFVTPQQRAEAEASKAALMASGRLNDPVVTPIRDAVTFYDAEDYHQDYYKKNPVRYKYYRNGCRRDQRLAELWGEK